MASQKKYLDSTGLKYMIDQFNAKYKILDKLNYFNFVSGNNKNTSISNLPIDKRLITVNLKSNGTFSLNGIPTAGNYIHILIKNTSSSQIIVSLPNASPYILVNADLLSIPSNKVGEINALSDGTNIYLRAI